MIMMLLLSFLLAVARVKAATPLTMEWSPDSYGPDGPWQAIRLYIGSNKQQLDLFPGARWASTILTDQICDNHTLSDTCYALDAGVYWPNRSSTYEAATDVTKDWNSWNWSTTGGIKYQFSYDTFTLPNNNGISIDNCGMTAVTDAYQRYPGGAVFPISTGTLSLGAPQLKVSRGNSSMEIINSALYTSNQIPSYSYGMHIGSASLRIPGSLVLGGYDQQRISGGVSAQGWSRAADADLNINLQSIGINVATGSSPFNSTNGPTNLSNGTASFDVNTPVQVNPIHPYIYLPSAICSAIAADLPVIYDEGLGMYLWNTSDSLYDSIMTSSAYLSFVFDRSTISNEQVTVKVPFPLLNLTLEAPIMPSPTPYFPCYPTDSSAMLGQAFLQAAFVGVNWGTGNEIGHWFLAQAPGPGLETSGNVVAINDTDDAIPGSPDTWEESWSAYWGTTDSSNSPTSNTSSPDNGLSTGAKAGIGVGCGIAGLGIIAVCALCLRRKRAAKSQPVQPQPQRVCIAEAPSTATAPIGNSTPSPSELDAKPKQQPFAELP